MTQLAHKIPFPSKTIDGVVYVDPLGDDKYWVKYYDLPQKDDINAYIELIDIYKKRFLKTVDYGFDINDMKLEALDEYIKNAPKTPGQRCCALFARGIENAKVYIKEHKNELPKETNELGSFQKIQKERLEKIVADYTAVTQYFSSDPKNLASALEVRRKYGHVDIDGVLREMVTEPYNIIFGMVHNREDLLNNFHNNRFTKAAQAMRCIDTVVQTMEELLDSDPRMKQQYIPLFKQLAIDTKERIQLQRIDPDFAEADTVLRKPRDQIHALLASSVYRRAHLPRNCEGGLNYEAKAIIRAATDLIYDIAKVRNEELLSAKDLNARVKEYLQKSRENAMDTPRSSWAK